MDNLSEAAWLYPFRSVFWAASFRSTGEVCPKEAVFLFRVLARGVGCSIGVARICDCVGEASFCGRLQLNNRNKASSKTSKD
jgi:hypothetical protein